MRGVFFLSAAVVVFLLPACTRESKKPEPKVVNGEPPLQQQLDEIKDELQDALRRGQLAQIRVKELTAALTKQEEKNKRLSQNLEQAQAIGQNAEAAAREARKEAETAKAREAEAVSERSSLRTQLKSLQEEVIALTKELEALKVREPQAP